jgi:hypothetical protein
MEDVASGAHAAIVQRDLGARDSRCYILVPDEVDEGDNQAWIDTIRAWQRQSVQRHWDGSGESGLGAECDGDVNRAYLGVFAGATSATC